MRIRKDTKASFCYDEDMSDSDKKVFLSSCRQLVAALKEGSLGNVEMPEDTNPGFAKSQREERLSYFTLPMALNYQRNSYALWESALKSWRDEATKGIFDVASVAGMHEDELREKLMRHKVALQPNKHVSTWSTIGTTVATNWGSISELIDVADSDYLKLRDILQGTHKKGFPYLSGPKIFNYWSFIISTYGGVSLKNRAYIEIALDTHVTKGSILLGVVSQLESEKLPKETIAARWRELLAGSGIDPIDMHSPLWFWSKNNFSYSLH